MMLEVLRQDYSRTAWSKCFGVKLESLERIRSVERYKHSSLQTWNEAESQNNI